MTFRAYPTASRVFHGYSWEGALPYDSNGTAECLTASGESRNFPTDVPLPTRSVQPLDSNDPRGLGYCYHSGYHIPINDSSFWSLFQDTILDTLHNKSNCKQEWTAMAPVGVAMQATFLLDTTTDFINERQTKSPTPSTSSTKTDPTPTDVLVDPFQRISQSEDEQESSRSKSDIKPSPTDAPMSPTIAEPIETKPAPDRTTSAVKQSLEASVSPEDQEAGSRSARPADQVSESRVETPTASADEIPSSGDKSVASSKATQLEILNSLIQDVGQQQSSVDHAAPASNNAPTLTLDGVTPTPDSSSEYVLGKQTLRAGGPAITISGTQIRLASDASAIVVGSSTSVLVASESLGHHVQAVSLVPALTLTANSGSAFEYVFGDQTIRPGGPAITVSGTLISLDSEATAVVVGSSTRPIVTAPNGGDRSQQAEVQSAGKPASILTLAGATATLNSASEYIVADQTLKPGGPAITVSGTPISLAPQATAVVVGSSTSILATAPHDGDQAQQVGKLASVLTLAGAIASLNSASEYVIEDQTLTPGENAITVSGTRISLAPHATAVVIGSTTSALPSVTPGIGDYVWAGIAGALEVAGASSMESRSEVVVTSTASDGELVVETIFTDEPTKSSPTDSSSSSAGTSSLASDEASLISSSSSTDSSSSSTGTSSSSLASGETSSTSTEAPDAASGTRAMNSNSNAAALICCLVFLMMCGL
jgi:uncharacterized protein YodC (DUF2158 family)